MIAALALVVVAHLTLLILFAATVPIYALPSFPIAARVGS